MRSTLRPLSDAQPIPSQLAGQTVAKVVRELLPGTSWNKARSLCRWNVTEAATLLAGGDAALVPKLKRRLLGQLDNLREHGDQPDEKVLAHLLAEHRPFAVAALEQIRRHDVD